MAMCLTLGITLLTLTIEIQLWLSSQCTVGALVWIDNASMYLRIALVFLTVLYMYLISPSVESYATAG